jgi:hypothetical protein
VRAQVLHTHTHTHTHTYTHTHTHTHAHTHAHTHTHTLVRFSWVRAQVPLALAAGAATEHMASRSSACKRGKKMKNKEGKKLTRAGRQQNTVRLAVARGARSRKRCLRPAPHHTCVCVWGGGSRKRCLRSSPHHTCVCVYVGGGVHTGWGGKLSGYPLWAARARMWDTCIQSNSSTDMAPVSAGQPCGRTPSGSAYVCVCECVCERA